MTFTDPIGDMFSRIRNGQMRSLNSVYIPSSNFRKNILEILKNEGYIKDYFIEKTENNKTSLKISLKYYEGDPVIKEIKRISKPGRRVYSRATSIPKVMNGLGLAILSTPKGVMSDAEARKNNLGGEVICKGILMSKIGKKNIIIPKESSIKIEGSNLTISGPKGTTKLTINDKIFSSKLNESEFQLLPLEKKIDKKHQSCGEHTEV